MQGRGWGCIDPEQPRPRGAPRSSGMTLFRDVHVAELQPDDWEEHKLGEGSYGVVCRATWRRHEVAVKVLHFPDRPAVDANRKVKKAYCTDCTDCPKPCSQRGISAPSNHLQR